MSTPKSAGSSTSVTTAHVRVLRTVYTVQLWYTVLAQH